ncbi:MAG: DNA adenine methylase [Candidatus Eutrophobiaceae bacterium]
MSASSRETGRWNSLAARPFLKWAGGKRSVVSEIHRKLPPIIKTYWEPFLGGGAVFFSLRDQIIGKAYLSDINADLMRTYNGVQQKIESVIKSLNRHAGQHNEQHYRKVRDRQYSEKSIVASASRFIYLNRTCYNGLYRVNKSGQFNVPMGRYANPAICNKDNLRAVSQALQGIDLKTQSFNKIKPKKGDLVYCDPPYDGTFNSYVSTGFTQQDQEALRDACASWRNAGAHVMVSNSDTKFIRSLFKAKDWTRHQVQASRNISRDSSGRGKQLELLILSK